VREAEGTVDVRGQGEDGRVEAVGARVLHLEEERDEGEALEDVDEAVRVAEPHLIDDEMAHVDAQGEGLGEAVRELDLALVRLRVLGRAGDEADVQRRDALREVGPGCRRLDEAGDLLVADERHRVEEGQLGGPAPPSTDARDLWEVRARRRDGPRDEVLAHLARVHHGHELKDAQEELGRERRGRGRRAHAVRERRVDGRARRDGLELVVDGRGGMWHRSRSLGCC